MGLRSAVSAEQCDIEVSQRLKRLPTILDKPQGEPEMSLPRMQDTSTRFDGFNNASFAMPGDTTPVEPPCEDYIAQNHENPRYRGVHVVVRYDGRMIEIQLRTQVMHSSAITVERLAGRMQGDLKSGSGPPEVLELLGAISEAMAIEERDEVV